MTTIEVCRAAFELKKPDARKLTIDAIRRSDRETAAVLTSLLTEHRNRRMAPDDTGPTPETLVRQRDGQRIDTIETLFRNRSLTFEQQAAALQISDICEALTSSLAAKCASYQQGRVDGGSGNGVPERMARMHHDCYLPWARWMADPRSAFVSCAKCGKSWTVGDGVCVQCGGKPRRERPHLGLVLSVCVYGASLRQCAVTYRMRPSKALRLLRSGLTRYAEYA